MKTSLSKKSCVLFFLAVSNGYSQPKNQCKLELGTFKLDHEPNSEYLIESYVFHINRQQVDRKQEVFTFTSNYPGLDTIYMLNNEGHDTVITRFMPGHTYAFTIGAGMAGFDVYERVKSKLKYSPVTIEVNNLPGSERTAKDTLVGFYCDLYGSAVGKYFTQNGKNIFAQPYKFTNEDGLAWIGIGKLIYPLKQREIMGEVPKVSYPDVYIADTENIVYLARVHVRFMHNEKVTAVYDVKTQKLDLQVK